MHAEPVARRSSALRLRPFVALIVVAAAFAGSPMAARAHHGGDVEWGKATLGPVTGTATKFAFLFPHVYVEVDVQQEGGTAPWTFTTRWTPTILRDLGWTRASIKPGDTVRVTYLPHVNKPQIGQMITMEVNGKPLPLTPPR
jgi:hypothetical protein